jgi:DNA mismatch repair ATPase MutS
MAGKSTFLKSLGISVYLAHAGFPVPARYMKISLLSGISTTINIPDDLNLGYSHFYSELIRIRKVAESIKKNHDMLIIFDELFRGTNVKDAHEGSLAIISAFAGIKTCFFAVSTHLMEIAEELRDKKSILFNYFEVENKNGMPEYKYKLKNGITDLRLGMHLIRQERIIETINEIGDSKRKPV